MPIYEYRCSSCQKHVSIFQRHPSSSMSPVCPNCGSAQLTRLISTFAVLRSEEARISAMAESAGMPNVDESDPASIARWARFMKQEMGDEAGPEFDEMMERMEAGEMPDEMDEGYGSDEGWEEDLE